MSPYKDLNDNQKVPYWEEGSVSWSDEDWVKNGCEEGKGLFAVR